MSTMYNVEVTNKHPKTPYVIDGVVCHPGRTTLVNNVSFNIFKETKAGKWLLENWLKANAPEQQAVVQEPEKQLDMFEEAETVSADETDRMIELLEVIEAIDDDNDDAWTDAGLVKLGYVKDKLNAKVTRADIEEVAPGKVRYG